MPKQKMSKFFLSLVSMLCALTVLPTASLANSECHLNITVKLLESRYERLSSYSSVADASQRHDPSEPFMVFSRSAEEAVLQATERVFCEGGRSSETVKVDLTLVQLSMYADNSELQRLRSEAIGANGAYAEVSVDIENSLVSARIIWNPRRMLRDQLLLGGWELDEVLPLLPFRGSEYRKYISEWDDRVLRASTQSRADRNLMRLKRRMPDDLYGLLDHGFQTTRMPFWGSMYGTIHDLMNKSLAGYTLVTAAAIDQSFDAANSARVTNIYDIGQPDIHILYEQDPWRRRLVTQE